MARLKRMVSVVVVVVGIMVLNAFLGLEVIGLTYRPFSWMTLCEAGEVTLYPMMHGILQGHPPVSVRAQGVVGTDVCVERSLSLIHADWQPVGDPVLSTGLPVDFVDTNTPQGAVFYRAKQTPR